MGHVENVYLSVNEQNMCLKKTATVLKYNLVTINTISSNLLDWLKSFIGCNWPPGYSLLELNHPEQGFT